MKINNGFKDIKVIKSIKNSCFIINFNIIVFRYYHIVFTTNKSHSIIVFR